MKSTIYLLLLSASLLASCDDGRIAEDEINLTEEGRVAKVNVQLSGTKSWPA